MKVVWLTKAPCNSSPTLPVRARAIKGWAAVKSIGLVAVTYFQSRVVPTHFGSLKTQIVPLGPE